MRVTIRKIFIAIFCLLSISNGFSKPTPPQPNGNKGPILPGLPIDDSLYAFLAFAVLFGIYIVYIYKFKRKTSV